MEDLIGSCSIKKKVWNVLVCVFSKGSVWKKYSIGISNVIRRVESDRWSLCVLGTLLHAPEACPGFSLVTPVGCLFPLPPEMLCEVGQRFTAELQLQRGQPGRLHEVREQLEQMWRPGGCPTAPCCSRYSAEGWQSRLAGAHLPPTPGALDIPPLLSKQGTGAIWREKSQ